MNNIMGNQRGFSLIELLLAGTAMALVAFGISQYFTQSKRANLEIAARGMAQQELDGIAQKLQKDFERHSNAANAIQMLPVGAPYTAPAGGGLSCGNMTIRQTILGTGGNPNTVKKIEYKTLCNREAFPDTGTRSTVHPDFSASCALSPTVVVSHWDNETSGGTGVQTIFPSMSQKALAICFRPNVTPNPTQYTAEISIAYPATPTLWKVLRRNVTLIANELGGGVEIIPPQ